MCEIGWSVTNDSVLAYNATDSRRLILIFFPLKCRLFWCNTVTTIDLSLLKDKFPFDDAYKQLHTYDTSEWDSDEKIVKKQLVKNIFKRAYMHTLYNLLVSTTPVHILPHRFSLFYFFFVTQFFFIEPKLCALYDPITVQAPQ